MDHSKFECLKNGLNGNAIVEKLMDDFEILRQLMEIKEGLHLISDASCIEFEFLIKEIMDYDIHSQNQWEEIYRLGNMKYNFLMDNQSQ